MSSAKGKDRHRSERGRQQPSHHQQNHNPSLQHQDFNNYQGFNAYQIFNNYQSHHHNEGHTDQYTAEEGDQADDATGIMPGSSTWPRSGGIRHVSSAADYAGVHNEDEYTFGELNNDNHVVSTRRDSFGDARVHGNDLPTPPPTIRRSHTEPAERHHGAEVEEIDDILDYATLGGALADMTVHEQNIGYELPHHTVSGLNHVQAELCHEDYTFAWICALAVELETSRLMFDEEHSDLLSSYGDDNSYILGRMGKHNVVMTALPVVYGKVNAANVARDLRRTFPGIRGTLMVGIGGGVPGKTAMCLGDVVVGTQVIEYDLGRALRNGEFEITSFPKTPARLLLSAVTTLASKHGAAKRSPRATELLRSRLNQYPPPEVPDVLYKADSMHVEYDDTCDYCDPSQIQRQRSQPRNNFLIHHGGVASGDTVNRDVIKRDYLAKKLKVICFEMEAAGIMDSLSCLPIRGICDYSDSHKNKHWQGYAAATAASYARELLETIAPLRKPSRLR